MKLRITDKAKEDLAEIDGYTRENWGNHQADTYMAELENRFVSLLGTPYLGSARPEVSQGYRCLPEGKHLIFYRIEGDVVEILGIPHARMDIERHLEREKEEQKRARDDDEERER